MSFDVTKRPEKVSSGIMPTGEADPLGWVERRVWTDRMVEALRRGGPEGGKWYSLHDKVFLEGTLRVAYEQVSRNKGASGVDGVSVEAFGKRLDEEIVRLQTSWKTESFRPQAIRRVYIPKPGSDEPRPLGIPTVRDRVVQAALRLILEPIFEQDFSDHSHGFRPGHGARGGLSEVMGHLKGGKVWVVDADLKGYFDSIPHGPLLKKVQRRVTDRRILGLLEQFLKAGIMENQEEHASTSGTPQGGVISPLLANIYLNDLDHQMEQSGRSMVRYADDFVILCRSQEEAEQALEEVRRWTVEAGLTLHPTKTRIVDMGQPGNYFDFLGFRMQRRYEKKPGEPARYLRLIRPKSLSKVKDGIRERTKRTNGRSLDETIQGLNRMLRGVFGYFRSAHLQVHIALDGMTRRRLRAILAKRQGGMKWGGGSCQPKWPNSFFAEKGLFSLEGAHRQYLHSCRGNR